MRALVTGATGYIGRAVVELLRESGCTVIGVTRSTAAATKLKAMGAAAEPGSLDDAPGLARLAIHADAVVHLAINWGPQAGDLDRAAVEAMLAAVAGQEKPFLYTSGVWVMGDTQGRMAGESAPLRPPAIVAWRPAVERLVMDAAAARTRSVVIRPAMVYGRGGGAVGGFVRTAREQGVVRVVGDGSNHWSFVHVDDLAALYVLALEKAAAGELYVAAAGTPLTVKEVAEVASRCGGAGGRVEHWPLEEARRELGPMADALVMDQQIGSTKAGRHLGWIPQQPSVLQELMRGSYAATGAA